MEIINIKDLKFKYILNNENTLNGVNLKINEGDFVVICGDSGCGKSTLIKHLKKELTPYGTKEGSIFYQGKLIEEMDLRSSATNIGYVMQNPDNQIVTDKVWHELAFGLENIGEDRQIIRRRVAEMANFFGIHNLFREESDKLSGGQKQILNLASTMLLQPNVLILDEPTSQLDPIAAVEFIDILKKINDEFATTIILVEHRLEDVFKVANRIVVMDQGKIMAEGNQYEIAQKVNEIDSNSNFFQALPTPARVALALDLTEKMPLTIKEGRKFLNYYFPNPKIKSFESNDIEISNEKIVELKNVYFRYTKDQDDILRGVNLTVYKNEIYCLLGGNGAGKTTTINNIAGLATPYRGKILIDGIDVSKNKNHLDNNYLAYLPQNPTLLFSRDTVNEELKDGLKAEQYNYLDELVAEFKINHLLEQHPYDLSGGEQQKVAIIKILLKKPHIILLDEPTKGLDATAKLHLANILKELVNKNYTIIIVSHDIEFCAQHSTRCAMFFDGEVVSEDKPRIFFKDNNFYTTAAAKMSRSIFNDVVLCEDVIELCKQNQH
ncbi:energy-coupling factor transporter ATP-binding protein EcfA2 [Bacilli bacterium PM5-3]|nr:energy-coupling factor transporter ATP-binding protein EcfA2 [Bacilli bacterium PM5-3]MDH6603360.1 energy-coupling factor transporter ATP-binding protein EcfA2 [Bacilli bacterium PM5-9]